MNHKNLWVDWFKFLGVSALSLQIINVIISGRFSQVPFVGSVALMQLVYFFSIVGIPILMGLVMGLIKIDKKNILALMIFGFFNWIFFYEKIHDQTNLSFAHLVFILSPLMAWGGLKWISDFKTQKDNFYTQLFLIGVFASLAMATDAALSITGYLFPLTYDELVFRVDRVAGIQVENLALNFEESPSFFKSLVLSCYNLLTLFIFFAVAKLMAEQKLSDQKVLRILIVPFIVAILMYCFFPITGPKYAFGWFYPESVREGYSWLGTKSFTLPAPRNGMPSMHLTGALILGAVCIYLENKIYYWLAVLNIFIMGYATIALQEHYFTDLIVAMPFAALLSIVLLNPYTAAAEKKARNIIVMFLLFIIGAWYALFLSDSDWLLSKNFIIFMMLLSGASGLGAYIFNTLKGHRMASFKEENQEILSAKSKDKIFQKDLNFLSPIKVAFFVSGFSGLLYEVVYMKNLAVVFGGSSLAATIVLATYMGGMALGGALGGFLVKKSARPYIWYGATEILIGLYAIITPFLFKLITDYYIRIAENFSPDSLSLVSVKFFLGVLVLLIPTMMMGATLPFMFGYLKGKKVDSTEAISTLYSYNIFGASIGALVGAYFILPTFGKSKSILLAAIISFLVALWVFNGIKTRFFSPIEINELDFNQKNIIQGNFSKLMFSLIFIFFSGFLSLSIEVLSIHMLSTIAGNSVYAFGLMLGVFLTALGAGAIINKITIKKVRSDLLIFISYGGLILSMVLSALCWSHLAEYFASFEPALQFHNYSFWARELIRALVCTVALFPSAFFIGLGYPSLFALVVDLRPQWEASKAAGFANAINTLGGIVGVVLINTLLLKIFGSALLYIFLMVVISLLLLIFMIVQMDFESKLHKTSVFGLALLVVSMVGFSPKRWDIDSITNGANVYFMARDWGHTIDFAESAEGGITSVARSNRGLTLLTNGKFQGNNSGEVYAQESFALLPLKYVRDFNSALVIGYGTGTSANVLYQNSFKNIEVAELSRDIVNMANRHFGNINGNVSAKGGVKMVYTDGRNMLMVTKNKYDLISMEITSIWFAGAANLYNKEFYQIAKSKLAPHGVLQQWLQFHHMSPKDLMTIILTARSVFKDVDVYFVGGQGILIAGDDLSYRQQNNHFKGFDGRSVNLQGTAYAPVLSADDLSRFYKKLNPLQLKYFISTDDNLYLEYNTPKGNALEYDTVAANLDYLKNLKKAEDTIPH